MKKNILLVTFCLVTIIGYAQKITKLDYRYNDIKIVAKDIANALLKKDVAKFKQIQSALLMPYSKFTSTLLPSSIYKDFAFDDEMRNYFILAKSILGKDSVAYKNYANDFYFNALSNQWINDPDNNFMNKNIYFIIYSSDNDKNKNDSIVYQFDIMLETKNQIKTFSFNNLIAYNNIIYNYRIAEYESHEKSKLGKNDFFINDSHGIYKLINNKLEKITGEYLQFEGINYTEEKKSSYEDVIVNKEEATPITSIKKEQFDQEPEIFDRAEVMPQFPGGISEMMKYLKDNLVYPALAKENGLQGKVIVKFIIDEDGSIKDPVILKDGVGGGASNEAIRLVKSMPKWKPGEQKGKPVKMYYTLPIVFKLN